MTHHMNHGRGGGLGRMALPLAMGALAGLALSQGRKVAMQGPSVMAGDWQEALKLEHRMVEKLFEALLATDETQVAKRNGLIAKIAYALTKHGIQEENVIYPAMMDARAEGQAEHLTHDHGQIKHFIYELKTMEASDPRWLLRAREFFECIQHHVREEEDEMFPAFAATLSQEENARLTKLMNWEGYKVA